MWEILSKAAKGGVRSSEFWLSLLAIVLPVADNAASNAHGTSGIVAGAVVAAAYSVSRAIVKAKTVDAAAPQASSEAAARYVEDAARRGDGVTSGAVGRP